MKIVLLETLEDIQMDIYGDKEYMDPTKYENMEYYILPDMKEERGVNYYRGTPEYLISILVQLSTYKGVIGSPILL